MLVVRMMPVQCACTKPFVTAAAQDGIQQVRHEDELSLHVEDMPLDGVVILDVPCRSPPLQVGMAEASQKTASADMQWSVVIVMMRCSGEM